MWNDIHNNADRLSENKIVKSLASGKLEWETDGLPTTSDLDGSYLPSEIALPISADATQLDAICAAAQNKSFVLHGPPGTGKSQTITNIIADALYHGKKVLFVAAKKAALDVVYHRMEQIGLTPFSLELHSNKSKKSDVLAQLARSLDTMKRSRNVNYEQEAERLQAVRREISSYVDALHHIQPTGWSLYDSITALERYETGDFAKITIPDAVYGQVDPILWQQWGDWLPQFKSIAKHIVHPEDNPLRALGLPHYSSKVQEDLEQS